MKRPQQSFLLFILSFFVALILSGCTKNNFDDEASQLIGRWECVLVEEIEYLYGVDNDTTHHDLGIDLEIEFIERGRICLYDGDEKLKSARAQEVTNSSGGILSVYITCKGLKDYLNNGDEIGFVILSEDSIFTGWLNFVSNDPSDLDTRLRYYFKRVQ